MVLLTEVVGGRTWLWNTTDIFGIDYDCLSETRTHDYGGGRGRWRTIEMSESLGRLRLQSSLPVAVQSASASI